MRRIEIVALDAIDEQTWDRLVRSFYSSHRWLQFSSTHGDAGVSVAVARDGGRVVGALPIHHFRGDLPGHYDPERLFDLGREGCEVVILGTRQGYESEVPMGVPEAERAELLAELIMAARSESLRIAGVEPWLMYAPHEVAEEVLGAVSDSEAALIDARVILRGVSGGLEQFRAALSDNASARVRKERGKFDRANLVLGRERLSDCHPELGALSSAVLQRYGQQISAADEEARFARQAATLDDRCIVFTARESTGRLVGFTQFFRWRDRLIGRVHGLDDDVARAAALYYNLTYYAPLEAAPELGIDSIDLGCDSFEAKVRRGGRVAPLYAVSFGASPAVRNALSERAQRTSNDLKPWREFCEGEVELV